MSFSIALLRPKSATMTLVHMVYWVLMVECIVLSMLCLPYVRNVVTYLGRFIPVQAIKWYGK